MDTTKPVLFVSSFCDDCARVLEEFKDTIEKHVSLTAIDRSELTGNQRPSNYTDFVEEVNTKFDIDIVEVPVFCERVTDDVQGEGVCVYQGYEEVSQALSRFKPE